MQALGGACEVLFLCHRDECAQLDKIDLYGALPERWMVLTDSDRSRNSHAAS
jgi:hypothetical protein